jgi:hypothetical protein
MSETSLIQRLGAAAFERLATCGARYDEMAALAELDEDWWLASANSPELA